MVGLTAAKEDSAYSWKSASSMTTKEAVADRPAFSVEGNALIAAVDAYMQLGDSEVNGEAAMQVTQQAMDGQLDSPDVQQGMINNMPSPTGPPQGMPPQGMPPQGPPPEGMPPQQGGLL